MDFSVIEPYSELCIPDALTELEKLDLYKWNFVFQPYDKSISMYDKNHIINIMKEYYEAVFVHEINYLQPFLIHTIKKEMKACKEIGILNRIDKIHERIEIKGSEIILHKNIEYHFDAKELNKISITASTFISPHLLMYEDKSILYLTMLVIMEEKEKIVPLDLVNLLKALGDETRLKILHEMRKEPATTQSLAFSLKLTEAGISKHLKMLSNARLVNKIRQGNYMLYSINKDAIDYIPYRLYEYIMR
ncbi:MAG: ArsR/SmtB family transcription factor [Sedimentibacter sp.]